MRLPLWSALLLSIWTAGVSVPADSQTKPELGREDLEQVLLNLVADDDDQVQRFTARLRQQGEGQAVTLLVEILKDGEKARIGERSRLLTILPNALLILTELTEPAFYVAVAKPYLNHDNRAVQTSCTWAVARLKAETACVAIAEVLENNLRLLPARPAEPEFEATPNLGKVFIPFDALLEMGLDCPKGTAAIDRCMKVLRSKYSGSPAGRKVIEMFEYQLKAYKKD